VQQRQILLLGGVDLTLKINDSRIARNRLACAYQTLRCVKHELETAQASEHIDHENRS
jgi:hypothetical protein